MLFRKLTVYFFISIQFQILLCWQDANTRRQMPGAWGKWEARNHRKYIRMSMVAGFTCAISVGATDACAVGGDTTGALGGSKGGTVGGTVVINIAPFLSIQNKIPLIIIPAIIIIMAGKAVSSPMGRPLLFSLQFKAADESYFACNLATFPLSINRLKK